MILICYILRAHFQVLLDSDKKKIYDAELQREELLRNLNMFQSGSKKVRGF